jgi:hypothetical protein
MENPAKSELKAALKRPRFTLAVFNQDFVSHGNTPRRAHHWI